MRKWRFYVFTLLMVVLVLGAVVPEQVQAGSTLDFGGGIQALGPFFLINAIITGIVSSIFINGCVPPGG